MTAKRSTSNGHANLAKPELRTVTVPPRASALIESMRDIGYTLETALADVVDNSITAHARLVKLFVTPGTADVAIGILDDGDGMTEGELIEAMRPGSRSPLEPRGEADLGRFGLGLKTASFSQCRRVSVVSRREGVTAAAVWDLARVAAEDAWVVELPDPASVRWSDELGPHGTLVVWQDLDRLVDADGSVEAGRVNDARAHLELVFHRFLAGEPGLRKVAIMVNGHPLRPHDPFHRSHSATIEDPVETLRIGGQDIKLQTFTLPHHQKASRTEWDEFEGREGLLRSQGFYVYRAKRLIIHGTWFGLARQREITKLARVRVDMPTGLDAEWKIDVLKASAQPPPRVREHFRRIIERIGGTSRRIYTTRGTKLFSQDRIPVWSRRQDKGIIYYELNPDHPAFATFGERLTGQLAEDFGRLLEIAGAALPLDALVADLNGHPNDVNGTLMSDLALQYALATAVDKLKRDGSPPGDVTEALQLAEPFRSNWTRVAPMIRAMRIDQESDEPKP